MFENQPRIDQITYMLDMAEMRHDEDAYYDALALYVEETGEWPPV